LSIRTLMCWFCVCLILPVVSAHAQYSDKDIDTRYPGALTEDRIPPPRYLIIDPTASTLPKGNFDITTFVFGNGGLLASTAIALTNRFQIGVSYGAESLLGSSKPVWNPRVGFQIKLQLLDEKLKVPAITVGFDDQGYGPFIDSLDRYTLKSKGLYAVISKNFYTLNVGTGFHAGINRSFENGDGDENPDVFLGWDFTYNQNISVLLEYFAGLNDNGPESVGQGRGYLNLGLRWEYSRRLVLEADLIDLLQNRTTADYVGRVLRIVYLEAF
jgi:hypothetical protein